MTTLIANIGTSDLAVKIDQYYIPVRFDRNEPNIDESNLTEDEQIVWTEEWRQSDIIKKLCPELGVTTNPQGRQQFSFRELTKQLLAAYKEDELKWHNRISPGRLQGVINTAKTQFNAQFAYIFVTDQPNQHRDDSVYLFQILKKWFWDEMRFQLIPKYIPSDISAISLDDLLNFYDSFFQQLDNQEEILVSIKGGTPQMQNALRLQAVSSTIPRQLFVDPCLSVKNILNGQPSQCQLTAYWKYMRNQKYQTVEQLLERWDFDGAINILKSWQSVLTFLNQKNILKKKEIKQSRKRLDFVVDSLKTARSLFNLDVEGARNIIDGNNELMQDNRFRLSEFVDENYYDSLLNLYTQSCIYKNLSQIANFLARVHSLYESIIHHLIKKKGGNQYLNNWKINSNQFQNQVRDQLFQEFKDLEERSWLEPRHSIKFSRYSKRNYLEIIIKHRAQINPNLQPDLDNWLNNRFTLQARTFNGILELLKSLDYWIEKRNELVHSAEGISQQRIQNFNNDRNNEACPYEEIVPVLSQILSNPLIELNRNYRQEFVEQDNYYIYSNAKESAIQLLKEDATNN